MANQRTGDWRRPWTASRGSLHQPAWPAQLSEKPHRATRYTLEDKGTAELHVGSQRLGPANGPAHSSTAASPPPAARRGRTLPYGAPLPLPPAPAMRGATHAPTPGRGGARCTPHPSTAIENTQGSHPSCYSCWDGSGRETHRIPPPLAFLLLGPRALSWKDPHFGSDAVSFQKSPGLGGNRCPFATWKSAGLK